MFLFTRTRCLVMVSSGLVLNSKINTARMLSALGFLSMVSIRLVGVDDTKSCLTILHVMPKPNSIIVSLFIKNMNESRPMLKTCLRKQILSNFAENVLSLIIFKPFFFEIIFILPFRWSSDLASVRIKVYKTFRKPLVLSSNSSHTLIFRQLLRDAFL